MNTNPLLKLYTILGKEHTYTVDGYAFESETQDHKTLYIFASEVTITKIMDSFGNTSIASATLNNDEISIQAPALEVYSLAPRILVINHQNHQKVEEQS